MFTLTITKVGITNQLIKKFVQCLIIIIQVQQLMRK